MKKVLKKYILFIGLGDWNIIQLKMLKSFKLKSIVINIDKKSKSLKIADTKIICDSRDYKKIFYEIKKKKLEKKICYVYTGSEFITSAAYVSKKLGLKWHSYKSAVICENKNMQKKLFVKKNILSPKYKVITNYNELNKNYFKTKKIILKPTDGHASKGISIVDRKKNSLKAFNFSKNFSKSGKVIVEEYIEGTLHDINALVMNNKFYRLGISDKTATKPPYAVINKIESPTKLLINEQKKLYKLFSKTCKSLNLNHGPVKGDYLRDKKGKFYLMEVSGRFHGPLSTLYALPNSLNITPFLELLRYLKEKKIYQHKIRTNYKNRTIITADVIKKKGQISLKKKGLFNKKKWTSNYDVPIYNIKKTLIKN